MTNETLPAKRLENALGKLQEAQSALKLAAEPAMQGKTLVVILPDSGERYLSSMLFDGLFSEQEMVQ